jgi:hypothetical protein
MALIGPKKARRSNAKTAYDLLTDCTRYMLEEPLRVNMIDWSWRGKKRILSMITELNIRMEGKRHRIPLLAPVCNTVGCIAGTGLILKGKRPRNECDAALTMFSGEPVTYSGYSSDHGLSHFQKALKNLFCNTDVAATYGTMKYAKIVVKRIRKFQKTYQDDLLAVSV